MINRDSFRGAAVFVLMGVVAVALPLRAQPGPVPPCGAEPVPAYPPVGDEPAVKFWRPADVAKDWSFPACIDSIPKRFSSLVTTAARFNHSGDAEALLRRIGAISELKGVQYWSNTHKRWQTLIVSAGAITGAKGDPPRPDFTPDELAAGTVVFFQQADNLAGKATYRLHITTASADRIAFEIENVNAMRYFIFTLYHPGELQSLYFLDRESDGVWRYYSVLRSGEHANSLTAGNASSSINRAVAFFRHFAGIQTDKEPPAAR